MALCFSGGMQLVAGILKIGCNVFRMHGIKRDNNGLWYVPMRQLFLEIVNHIAPTAHDIHVVDGDGGDSDGYFYQGTRKQPFVKKSGAAKLERSAYNREQLEAGNFLIDREQLYQVNKTQQNILEKLHDTQAKLVDKELILAQKDELITQLENKLDYANKK